MRKKSYSGMNTGSASILVIFIVLCLSTLAVLSLVSARADYALSKKRADRTTAYYNACNAAEAKLAETDPETNREKQIKYTVPIDDSQELDVVINIAGNGSYTIEKWETSDIGSWKPDDYLNLIQ